MRMPADDQGVPASVAEAVDRISLGLERRAASLARSTDAQLRLELPELRATADRPEDLKLTELLPLGTITAIASGQIPAPPPSYSEQVRTTGRSVARTGIPLRTAIRAFEVVATGVTRQVIELAQSLGPHGEAASARFLRAAHEVSLRGMASLTDGYADESHDATSARQEARDELVFRFASEDSEDLAARAFDVVFGRVDETLPARAASLGLLTSGTFAVIATPLEGEGWVLDRVKQAAIGAAIQASSPTGCLWGASGTFGALIVSDPETTVATASQALDSAIAPYVPGNRVFAVGLVVAGFSGIKESLEDALENLRAATTSGMTGLVRREDVVVPRLLLASKGIASSFASMLAPFGSADPGGELLRTLDAYLASGCSATRTASALYVHRNTLRNRLNKIEELLGFPVDARRLHLQLAIEARRIGA